MIKEIRDYITNQVLKVDDTLLVNNSAFYDFDIGESRLDKSYQIEINNIIVSERNDEIVNTISILVSIFGFGYRNEISNYDSLLDKAICIRDEILDIKNFSNVNGIINIVSDGVNSSKLPSDDNGFKIDINLTLTQAYFRG